MRSYDLSNNLCGVFGDFDPNSIKNSKEKLENKGKKSQLNKQVNSQLSAIATIARISLAAIAIGTIGLGAYFSKKYFLRIIF